MITVLYLESKYQQFYTNHLFHYYHSQMLQKSSLIIFLTLPCLVGVFRSFLWRKQNDKRKWQMAGGELNNKKRRRKVRNDIF